MKTATKLLGLGLPVLMTLLLIVGCAGQSAPAAKPSPATEKPASTEQKSSPTAPASAAPAKTSGEKPSTAGKPGAEAALAAVAKAAEAEGTFTWWTSVEAKEVAKIAAKFNERYPKVKVEPFAMHSEDIIDKMVAEAQAKVFSADLVDTGSRDLKELSRRGLLMRREWDTEFGLNKELLSPNKDALVVYGNVVIPAYNTNLVPKDQAPKNWDDLLDPKWSGKVALDTDPKQWTTLVQAWGQPKVEEFLAKLAANKPLMRKGHTAITQLLAAGEFPVAGELYLQKILQFQKEGAPIEWVRANPAGGTMNITSVAKNAVHPNASTLFLLWMVSPEGQLVLEDVTSKALPYPGSGSNMAQLLEKEGVKLSIRGWDIGEIEDELSNKYAKILGVAK